MRSTTPSCSRWANESIRRRKRTEKVANRQLLRLVPGFGPKSFTMAALGGRPGMDIACHLRLSKRSRPHITQWLPLKRRYMQASLLTELSKLPEYRELIVNFTLREIKAKYKQAFLGVTWALIQPVVLMAMLTVVFSYFARVPSDGLPYPSVSLRRVAALAILLQRAESGHRLARQSGRVDHEDLFSPRVAGAWHRWPRRSSISRSLRSCSSRCSSTISLRQRSTWLWVVPIFLIQTVALARADAVSCSAECDVSRRRASDSVGHSGMDVRDADHVSSEPRASEHPALLFSEPHGSDHRELSERHAAQSGTRT